MDGIWLVYLFLAAFPALIVFAAAYKYLEFAEAARWPSTQGRIVTSTSQARNGRAGGPKSLDTERRNFAKIIYQYDVGGETYRCDRVSIGEDMGDFEVAETIAKYPVGKPVTVYYNPRKRDQAVLERDAPPGIWKAVTIIVLVMIGLIVGSAVGFHKLGDLVSSLMPGRAEAPFVAACLGFALLFALVALGIQRNLARMRRWPTVAGKIEASDVRAFKALSTNQGGGGRWVTRYRPNIIYAYEVGGVRYMGDKVGTTARVSTNIASLMRPGERFAKGSAVTIHYNPENPAESILAPRSGPAWLLWLVPIGVLALAYFAAR